MAVSVTIHHPGRPDVTRWIHTHADHVSHIVEQHFRRPLQTVRVTLTNPRGLVDLKDAAARHVAGIREQPTAGSRSHQRAIREAAQHAGATTAHPDGGVLILVNTEALRDTADAALVLAHEMVHADQYGRPGVRQQFIAEVLNQFGYQPDKTAARAWAKTLRAHEREAYRLDKKLARKVVG